MCVFKKCIHFPKTSFPLGYRRYSKNNLNSHEVITYTGQGSSSVWKNTNETTPRQQRHVKCKEERRHDNIQLVSDMPVQCSVHCSRPSHLFSEFGEPLRQFILETKESKCRVRNED